MHDTNYCWRPECIYPYESLRFLLGKFMLLNHVGLAQLNHVDWFSRIDGGKENLISSKTNLLSKKIFSENGGKGINPVAFQNTLGLSDEQLNYSTIDSFLSLNYCEHDNLRHCPSCLEMGFHSPFHQIKMFNRCLIHGDKLVTQCVNCKNPFPYSLQSGESFHPFGCEICGHIYMKEGRAIENLLFKKIPEIAEFFNILLVKRYGNNVTYEKKLIPSHSSPPESIFQCGILSNCAPNGVYERNQQMTPYRWSNALDLKLDWLHKTSAVRPQRHIQIRFPQNIYCPSQIDLKGIVEPLSLKQTYKSIQRHFRNRYLKANNDLWRIKTLGELATGAVGSVIKCTDDTRCVLAAAYIQLSLHHEYLMKNNIDMSLNFRYPLPERHAELFDLFSNNKFSPRIKQQLITRILAEECYSGFIEYSLRALVQRKRGKLVFDSCYRDKRYDSHWLININKDNGIQLHLWSKRTSIERIYRYIQRHGY